MTELLSASTRCYDQRVKLDGYRELAGVTHILLVDPEAARVRHVRHAGRGWADGWLEPGEDVVLDALGLTLPHAEMFAAD